MELFCKTLSEAMATFTDPRHGVFVEYKAGRECFPVTRAPVLRKFAKDALVSGTDAGPSAEDTEAAAAGASSVPRVVVRGVL